MKTVLGRGSVVSALLGDLAQRGVDFSEPRLYVLDGARALVTGGPPTTLGEEASSGSARQLHKRRNVVWHLREEDRQSVEARLAAAYALRSTEEAQQALEQLHRELQELNPSAARSLERMKPDDGLPMERWFRRTDCQRRNPFESPFNCGRDGSADAVKCWQKGEHLSAECARRL